MNAPPPYHVVVIGGGITGLACALRLQEHSNTRPEALDITVLEAASHTGGKLVTEHVGEFIVDAGADVFVTNKPDAVNLCTILGIADRVQEPDPNRRKTFLRENGELIPAELYGDIPIATLRGGMQELVDTTARSLTKATIQTSTVVTAIRPVEPRYQRYQIETASGTTLVADAVVLAIPAPAAADPIEPLSAAAAAALRSVRYRGSVTVSAGFAASDVPHALEGYGYVVPNATAGSVSACTWTSSKIPGRAPAGYVLLRGYVHAADGLTVDDAVVAVLDELRITLGVQAPPLFTRGYYWANAIPVIAGGDADARSVVRDALTPYDRVFIAGGAFDGVGIPDSIRSGHTAADNVWDSFFPAANTTPSAATPNDPSSSRSPFSKLIAPS